MTEEEQEETQEEKVQRILTEAVDGDLDVEGFMQVQRIIDASYHHPLGKEAEELRKGLEGLCRDAGTVDVELIQELLETVDARDAVLFLEVVQPNQKQAAQERVLAYLGAAAALTDADRVEIDAELGLGRIIHTPKPRYYTAIRRGPEQHHTLITLAYNAEEARVQLRAGLVAYLEKETIRKGGETGISGGFSEDPFTEVRPSTDAEIHFPWKETL